MYTIKLVTYIGAKLLFILLLHSHQKENPAFFGHVFTTQIGCVVVLSPLDHQTNKHIALKIIPMKTIALNRLGLIALPEGEGWSDFHKVGFLTELGNLGYRITNPELLDSASEDFFKEFKTVKNALTGKRSGVAEKQYVPLFKNFPNEVPEEGPYFIKRLIGYMFREKQNPVRKPLLEHGDLPKWLFNIYDFGADPVTQLQVKSLYDLSVLENASKRGDSHTEWMDIALCFDDSLSDHLLTYLQQILYAKSSVKEDLRKEALYLLRELGSEDIDTERIVFKENLALLGVYYWWTPDQIERISDWYEHPTDLLRLFAAISGTDTSLISTIKYPKMNRKQRKLVLGILEKSSMLEEQLKAYGRLWLQVGRSLHVGEYAKRFPRTAKAFNQLRNSTIRTYASEIERLIDARDLSELLIQLEKRPGLFARRLHEVLRRFPAQTEKVMASFEEVANRVEVKNLLVMYSYFDNINSAKYRTVVNKSGKMVVLENSTQGVLREKNIVKVLGVLQDAIIAKLKTRENWASQRIWVDDALRNYTVPLQQRKASDGIITLGRGSRIPVEFDKVLRLFVYWKQRQVTTDLDLSVIQYGPSFNYIGHVSYTQLKDQGIVHSGDLQSAPYGATEFIDISLKAVNPGVRYLLVQVHRYCGEAFSTMTCHAGWMMRKEVNADLRSFDIKTVVNKFDVNGTGGYAIPLVVDLYEREIILTDLYVSGKAFHNNVESSSSEASLLASALSKFPETRPNLQDLAMLHVVSRNGVLVSSPSEADITFGTKDCTYNASDVEKILSELI